MKTILASDWSRSVPAYIWEETGNGALRLVTGIRADWWIVTGFCSWCCCPDTTLYVFADDAEHAAYQEALRARLVERRKLWDRRGAIV